MAPVLSTVERAPTFGEPRRVPHVTRRAVLAQLLVLPAAAAAQTRPLWPRAVVQRLDALESESGGRLGVAALDVGTGERLSRRADERFAMCSTFKVLAVAYVLTRTDRRHERLDRRVTVTAGDLVPHSPVTSAHAGGDGMTVEALCAAAITVSDNSAANLLLRTFGGPAGLTAFARSVGDRVTRLDRFETALNEAVPGDPRDTTSPAAMLAHLERLLLGDALSRESRERLTGWLRANQRAPRRLRAGFPEGWQVADKPGSGAHGATNDVGIVWPIRRAPLLVSVYFAESALNDDDRDAVLARVARIISA